MRTRMVAHSPSIYWWTNQTHSVSFRTQGPCRTWVSLWGRHIWCTLMQWWRTLTLAEGLAIPGDHGIQGNQPSHLNLVLPEATSELVRCWMKKMLLSFCVWFHLLSCCSSIPKLTLITLWGLNVCHDTVSQLLYLSVLTYWRSFNAQDTFYSSGTQFALSRWMWM